jgi:hypothetical protein
VSPFGNLFAELFQMGWQDFFGLATHISDWLVGLFELIDLISS